MKRKMFLLAVLISTLTFSFIYGTRAKANLGCESLCPGGKVVCCTTPLGATFFESDDN